MNREDFQKTVSERFQNTDSGFGNMTQRELILLQIASNVYDEVVKNCSTPDVVNQSEQLLLNQTSNKEYKKLMKTLYPKNNSKKFRK